MSKSEIFFCTQSTRDKSKLGLMGAGGIGVTDQALTYLDGSLPGE